MSDQMTFTFNKTSQKNVSSFSVAEQAMEWYLNHLQRKSSDAVKWAGKCLINHLERGHICIDQNDFDQYLKEHNESNEGYSLSTLFSEQTLQTAQENKLEDLFVWDGSRLYLHQFWQMETQIASWIHQKAEVIYEIETQYLEYIDSLFPPISVEETDWQKVAVKLSLFKQLLFLSGGPGTGKTYTIQKIIETHQTAFGEEYRILMAAPTGKAAQRLNESMEKVEFKYAIKPAQTVHSLLGARGEHGVFSKNSSNQLLADLLIIDEASMLDIQLWFALKEAIPKHCRVLFLGDHHQLASVEAGYILGDICSGSTNDFSPDLSEKLNLKTSNPDQSSLKSVINDAIITLTKSFRFDNESGIRLLAEAIKKEDSKGVLTLLKDPAYPDISLKKATGESLQYIQKKYGVHQNEALRTSEQPLSKKNEYQILCATRSGNTGVEKINERIEQQIKRKLGIPQSSQWYEGRPIMIKRNSRILNVRNGDIGVFMKQKGQVQFDEQGERFLAASRLQDYEPAHALTIHKSQGSEYEHVAIMLPNQRNQVLNKELLYTSVTRARKSVLVVGSDEVITYCVAKKTDRNSGLKQKIWG